MSPVLYVNQFILGYTVLNQKSMGFRQPWDVPYLMLSALRHFVKSVSESVNGLLVGCYACIQFSMRTV